MVELLSVGMASKLLDLSPQRVRQLSDSGDLEIEALAGRQRLFTLSAVQRLVRERETKRDTNGG